jgi:protein involved in polysaccharide export with SLBB domain
VSIDFAGDSIPAVPLRNGDRFVVPRDPDAVLVIGQVKNPGYIPYVPDANVDYYLNQAGGLGPAATNIYVREAGSGLLRSPGDEQLRSGDYIFVDRSVIADTESLQSLALQEQQLDFQQERERADNRFQYIQTGLALIGTAISVVTTYLLITQEN